MNVMQRYTWETLKRNRKRTIVTIIGVMISAAMITAVAILMLSFVDMLQRMSIADGGNWHVRTLGVPAANVAQLKNDSHVDRLTLSRDLGYSPLQGSKNPSKRYLFVRELDQNGFAQMALTVKDGRLPQKDGELAVSETLSNNAGIAMAIGDTITLTPGQRRSADGRLLFPNESVKYKSDADTGEDVLDPQSGERMLDETLMPGQAVTYTVVGILQRPTFEPSWSAACGAVAWLDPATLNSGTVDAYYTVRPVTRGIFDQGKALAAAVGATGETSFHEDLLRYYGVVKSDSLFSFLLWFVAILSVIIVAASVSMIYNAFAISVSERSRQLGLLASVGATCQQKRASVYFEALLIGVAGIPLGVLAGIGGIAATLVFIQPLLGSFLNGTNQLSMRLIVSPAVLAFAVALSAATIFLSAFRPARRASRITPIDAIRQAQDVRVTRRAVRTGWLTRKLFGFEADIALKNLKRSRRRYRATIVSLVISIVLFLTVSTYTSMLGIMGTASTEGINFDIVVSYSDLTSAQMQSTGGAITGLPSVTGSAKATIARAMVRVGDRRSALAKEYAQNTELDAEMEAGILTLDDAAWKAYAAAAGATASPGQPWGILINDAQGWLQQPGGAARKLLGPVLDVRAGETLPIVAGDESAASVDLTLGAVTALRPMGVANGEFNRLTIVVPASTYDILVQELGKRFGGDARHQLFLTTSDDQVLERQIAEISSAMPASAVSVYNVHSYVRSQQNFSLFLGVFIYGFIALISLICITNIFNTVSTNIALRRKEFAMLRSVGMTPKGFGSMLRYESVFYGLKGLLWGLPISAAIAVGLNQLNGTVMGTEFILPWQSYLVAILMIFVIVSVTMLYSTRRIKKENILEALREENL